MNFRWRPLSARASSIEISSLSLSGLSPIGVGARGDLLQPLDNRRLA